MHANNKTARQQEEGILPPASGAQIPEYDYEDVLERISFGKTQWVLLFISGLLTLTSMAAQTSLGLIAVASQCEFEMSQAEKGIMISSCVAGIFLSTYFWGYVSDAIGRRTVLLYGTLVSTGLEFITMFVTNVWVFNFINLLMGISLGGVSAAIYAYLSEFNTPKYRAVVINYSTMFVSIAAIYVPATAWLVLSADWSVNLFDGGFVFRPWRLIILLSLLPGLIGALMLLPFPESPKLLLAQQKQAEALKAVDWICKFNTGRGVASILETDDYTLRPEHLGEEAVLGGGGRRGYCAVLADIWKATVPLVHKPHGLHFIISAMAVFGLFFSSSGLQIWYPEIVNRSAATDGGGGGGGGGGAGNASTVCDILDASFARQTAAVAMDMEEVCDDSIKTKTYVDNIILGCAFLVGFIVQGVLLNPIGRKNVLLAALAIATFSGVLLHFVANATWVLVLFCLYILMPGLSISIMCGALVDLVPTQLRGKAVSIALTLGRLGIIVAANLIGVMLEPLCNSTFGIFTASMILCALLVHFLPI